MLLVLMLVAVALPAVSFFAMHARMLDRQEVLSNNYAVRDGPFGAVLHERTRIHS